MSDLLERERLKYERIHAVPGYSPGPGEAHVATFMGYAKPGESVIDFGCGTGDAAVRLRDAGMAVKLVDITRKGLRHDFDGNFYEASLHDLPWDLPRADWGFCCDVMEHLPEEWIKPALDGMFRKVDRIYFSISGAPDGWGKAINDVLHLTVKPSEWWKERIQARWSVLAQIHGGGKIFTFIASDDQGSAWKRRMDQMWSYEPHRTRGSMELRMVPFVLKYVKGGPMNCYCCGTGRAVLEYRKAGIMPVNMTDISDTGLAPTVKELIGNGVTFALAPLWRLPAGFPETEWGVCIDALMELPPTMLDASLAEIRRTCRNLIVEVYDWDWVHDGVNYTTIVGDRKWWRKKLLQFYPVVQDDFETEAANRYYYVCRG